MITDETESVDLYLHSAAGLTREDLDCWFAGDLGDGWQNLAASGCFRDPAPPAEPGWWWCEHARKVDQSPSLLVSSDDRGRGWPSYAEQIKQLVPRGTYPILDADLRARLLGTLGPYDPVEEFRIWLDAHMGESLFLIVW